MKRITSLAGLFFALTLPALAQVNPVPPLMNFQGRLAKPDGTPVSDGSHVVVFTLYDNKTGGTQKWTEADTVTTRNGAFAVLLGNGTALTDAIFATNVWLEIKVDGGAALTPRQQIVSVAHAFKADTVPDGSITAAQIKAGTITADKLASGAGFTLPFSATLSSTFNLFSVTNTGSGYGGFFKSAGLDGLYAESTAAGGNGIQGIANTGTNAYAVTGTATQGYGGYFFGGTYGLFSGSTSGYGLYGTTASGTGIYGNSNSGVGISGNSSTNNGVVGNSNGGAGFAGVSGTNTNANGIGGNFTGNIGVIGTSNTANGNGVSGISTNGAGIFGSSNNYGGYFSGGTNGVYASSSGIGVYGSGTSGGVSGVSSNGSGVSGTSTTGTGGIFTSGGTNGLTAESTRSGGNGIVAAANTGTAAYGVYGLATQGYGGYFDGGTYGAYGNSNNGIGLYGRSNGNHGVFGITGGTAGYAGVYGKATQNTGIGVYGAGGQYGGSFTGLVSGVYGVGNSSVASGVTGTTASSSGAGVFGINTGGGPGVMGNSSGGVAGLFEGDLSYSGSLIHSSDARYKMNITPLHNALEDILNLRGVTYEYRREEFKDKNFAKGTQYGFIAQEVETVLPDLVHKDSDGYRSLDYTQVVPVLVEAVKTLKSQMDALTAENATLKKQNVEIADLKKQLAAVLEALKSKQDVAK